MQGGSGDHAGLIPRSVKQILETSGKMSGQGWRYSLEVSFLEVSTGMASIGGVGSAALGCDAARC